MTTTHIVFTILAVFVSYYIGIVVGRYFERAKVKHRKETVVNIDQLRLIVSKARFKNFKFNLTDVRGTDAGYTLHFSVIHYGSDNETGSGPHNLTYMGSVKVDNLNENSVKRATYTALLHKLRHEASEIFTWDGKAIFHEHNDPLYGAGFPMIDLILE